MSVVKPRRYAPTGIGRTCARYDLDEPFNIPSARPIRAAGINQRALDPYAGDPSMGSCINFDDTEAATRRSRCGRKPKGVIRVTHEDESAR